MSHFVCSLLVVFMFDSADSLTCVCAHKDGHHFLWWSDSKAEKPASDSKLQKWQTPAPSSTSRALLVCSSHVAISLSRAARLAGQSAAIAGVREDTAWRGVFSKAENLLVLTHITESAFRFSPRLVQKHQRILCGWRAANLLSACSSPLQHLRIDFRPLRVPSLHFPR